MRNHQKCLYMANVKMMCDNDTAFYLESGRREPSPVLTTGLLTTSTTATTTATTDWFSTEEVSQASTINTTTLNRFFNHIIYNVIPDVLTDASNYASQCNSIVIRQSKLRHTRSMCGTICSA